MNIADIAIAEMALIFTTYDGSEVILAQDESITIGMYFLPTLYLDYEVELDIDSNDPEPPYVPVTGVGTMQSMKVQQDFNTAVDVWVFDNRTQWMTTSTM